MGPRTAPDFSKLSLDPALVPEVDRTYGYLGVKLDTPLARLPGMQFAEQRGELAIYHRPDDSLQVGQARVAYIEYRFAGERLREVAIGFDNLVAGTRLRNAFSRVYGRGFGTNRVVCWWGEHAQIRYRVAKGGRGQLLISTVPESPSASAPRLVASGNKLG